MVAYKCMDCQQEIKHEIVKKRVRCPYCGSKLLHKPETIISEVEAI